MKQMSLLIIFMTAVLGWFSAFAQTNIVRCKMAEKVHFSYVAYDEDTVAIETDQAGSGLPATIEFNSISGVFRIEVRGFDESLTYSSKQLSSVDNTLTDHRFYLLSFQGAADPGELLISLDFKEEIALLYSGTTIVTGVCPGLYESSK